MSGKKVIIVGAGPGGLTAGMILAHKGYKVDIYEKAETVGGRNAAIKLGEYTFDTGPTFLMMLYILDEVFEKAGRKVKDYLDIKRIEPMYQLNYGPGRSFYPTADEKVMKEQIEGLFPGEYEGYKKYIAYEGKKINYVVPCLRIPYHKFYHMGRATLLKAVPHLDAHTDLFSHLGKFYKSDELKLAFTFQAKYLGMSPWNCPATFSIISYIEHTGGIHHPIGGLCEISHAMAKVIEEDGGKIHTNQKVDEVIIKNGKAVGIKIGDKEILADKVIINADVGYAIDNLLPKDQLKTWTPQKLEKAGLSCSIYMLYLGVDTTYDIPHHNIFFAKDYKKNVMEMTEDLKLSEDFSFYIQNACKTDPTLAPKGKSTIYVLVPVPNTRGKIDWKKESKPLRDKVVKALEEKAGLTDLSKHIEQELVISPADWEDSYNVYRGAVFNLAHTINQMLYFRPHNEYQDFKGLYLVGGGTHPGSGLPTIYQSGMISAELLMKST